MLHRPVFPRFGEGRDVVLTCYHSPTVPPREMGGQGVHRKWSGLIGLDGLRQSSRGDPNEEVPFILKHTHAERFG